MKKIIVICAGFFLLFACAKKHLSERREQVEKFLQESEKLKVLTTTEMIRNLVDQLGKDQVHTIALITKGLDPHSYELVKGDDELLHFSDLIISNGLGLEHGASLSHYLKKSVKNVFLGSCLQDHPKILYKDGIIDPHIWMDISLWQETVDYLADTLSRHIPEKKSFFQKNAQILKQKMLEEHAYIKNLFLSIPQEKRYLVTTHDAFSYFTRAYLAEEGEKDWSARCMAPEGLSPDSQLNCYDIKKIIDHLEQFKIVVIFTETGISQDSIKKVLSSALDKNIQVRISDKSLYSDSMIETDAAIPYFVMMRYNAHTLSEKFRQDND
jgi:manganese/zinc/iron transport system substrate-binding protein